MKHLVKFDSHDLYLEYKGTNLSPLTTYCVEDEAAHSAAPIRWMKHRVSEEWAGEGSFCLEYFSSFKVNGVELIKPRISYSKNIPNTTISLGEAWNNIFKLNSFNEDLLYSGTNLTLDILDEISQELAPAILMPTSVETHWEYVVIIKVGDDRDLEYFPTTGFYAIPCETLDVHSILGGFQYSIEKYNVFHINEETVTYELDELYGEYSAINLPETLTISSQTSGAYIKPTYTFPAAGEYLIEFLFIEGLESTERRMFAPSWPEAPTMDEAVGFGGPESSLVELSPGALIGFNYIGYSTFINCVNLRKVIIPRGVVGINSAAFLGCTSLEVVVLPSTLLSIGSDAFSDCINLCLEELPSSVTHIWSYAFLNCSNLKLKSLPYNIRVLGSYIFYRCAEIEQIEYRGVTYTDMVPLILAVQANNKGWYIDDTAFEGSGIDKSA